MPTIVWNATQEFHLQPISHNSGTIQALYRLNGAGQWEYEVKIDGRPGEISFLVGGVVSLEATAASLANQLIQDAFDLLGLLP